MKYSLSLLILFASVFSFSCKKDNSVSPATVKANPTLQTIDTSEVEASSAKVKVTITNEGTSAVMGSGVAWATTPNPTTYDHMVPASGVGSGTFTVNITGLPFNTKIYARGYATNGSGTEYGNEINFTTDNIIANVTGYIYSQTAGSITYLSWNINCSTPGVVPVKFGLLGAAIGVTLKYPDHVIFQDNANSFPIIGSTYPPGLPANQRGFVVTNVGVTLLD